MCVRECVSGIGCLECDVMLQYPKENVLVEKAETFKAECFQPFRLTVRPLSIFIAGVVLAHFSSRMFYSGDLTRSRKRTCGFFNPTSYTLRS